MKKGLKLEESKFKNATTLIKHKVPNFEIVKIWFKVLDDLEPLVVIYVHSMTYKTVIIDASY
jgi:hypothetical protein